LSVIEKPWSSVRSSASGSFCKVASFCIYFVTVEYAMESDRSTSTSSAWTSLAESPFRWKKTTIDVWFILLNWTDWRNERAVKEPRNGFFLSDWVSDLKAVIIHNHQRVWLFCACGNYFAIMVKTSRAPPRWNTLEIPFWQWFLFKTTENMALHRNSYESQLHKPDGEGWNSLNPEHDKYSV
jgi:hypothetical protein